MDMVDGQQQISEISDMQFDHTQPATNQNNKYTVQKALDICSSIALTLYEHWITVNTTEEKMCKIHL